MKAIKTTLRWTCFVYCRFDFWCQMLRSLNTRFQSKFAYVEQNWVHYKFSGLTHSSTVTPGWSHAGAFCQSWRCEAATGGLWLPTMSYMLLGYSKASSKTLLLLATLRSTTSHELEHSKHNFARYPLHIWKYKSFQSFTLVQGTLLWSSEIQEEPVQAKMTSPSFMIHPWGFGYLYSSISSIYIFSTFGSISIRLCS